jgi:hypothetical protein
VSDDVTTLSSNASCRPSLKVLLMLVLLVLLVLVLLVLVLLVLVLVLLLLLFLVLAIGLQWQRLCGRPVESSRVASWSAAQRHVCCCWPWLAANTFSSSARLVR